MPAPEMTPISASEEGATIDPATAFRPLRSRLVGIAYRMLGSVADAEDIVQDAYARWHATDRSEIRDPAAYLARVVTHLCLDHLKSARVRRESYVGPWLPAPLIETPEGGDTEDVSLVLMLALERLSPLERAAFLLHDVFGLSFDEIAGTLGREASACRQLATRARRHVREARPRYVLKSDEGLRIADAFFEASRTGDTDALRQLLAEDVVAYTDGGGRRPAALNPILGRDRVARMFLGLARKSAYQKPPLLHCGLVNALPGFVTVERGGVLQTTTLLIENASIAGIYIVRNPDKLRHLSESGLYCGAVQ